MDNFGDIVTFLLVIVFSVIFPVIGALAKRKTKVNKPLVNPNGGDFDESEFESVFSFDEENLPQENEKNGHSSANVRFNEIYQETSIENIPYYNPTGNNNKFEKQEIISSDSLTEHLKENVKKPKLEQLIGEDFDAKKAIIYSEILNVKHF